MLSPSTRNRIKEILKRLSNDEMVTLEERFFLQEAADKDQSVNSWLKKARRTQQSNGCNDEIDDFIESLDLGAEEPNSYYKPDQEDLGEWFIGAPSWLGRS